MGFRYKMAVRALLLSAAVLLLCSCKKGVFVSGEAAGGYTKAQAMVIAATEKNRYEEAYTSRIWQVSMGELKISFEDYLLQQVEAFLEELRTINLLAEDKGIVLESSEKDKINQAAEEYYLSLTKEDIAYLGVELEDIQRLYRELYVSDKTVNELTKHVDLEVSDSEARVIQVLQIRMRKEAAASQAWEEVSAEGADFESVARKYTIDRQIQFQMFQGSGDPEMESIVFALEEGEMSGVVQSGGGYYIVKSIKSYDEAATLIHKKEISTARKNTAFLKIYNEFRESKGEELRLDNGVDLSGVTFTGQDGIGNTKFFEIFNTYFRKPGGL